MTRKPERNSLNVALVSIKNLQDVLLAKNKIKAATFLEILQGAQRTLASSSFRIRPFGLFPTELIWKTMDLSQ
jgi:hypothetical protein